MGAFVFLHFCHSRASRRNVGVSLKSTTYKTIYILVELDPRFHDDYIYELEDDKRKIGAGVFKYKYFYSIMYPL